MTDEGCGDNRPQRAQPSEHESHGHVPQNVCHDVRGLDVKPKRYLARWTQLYGNSRCGEHHHDHWSSKRDPVGRAIGPGNHRAQPILSSSARSGVVARTDRVTRQRERGLRQQQYAAGSPTAGSGTKPASRDGHAIPVVGGAVEVDRGDGPVRDDSRASERAILQISKERTLGCRTAGCTGTGS
jgi:hypothetical protein